MKKLNGKNSWSLFDKQNFKDIYHFIFMVDNYYIDKDEGYGHYVYVDEDCQLYIDEDSEINIDELYSANDLLDNLIRKKSNEKYHLIGVFWYWHNK